MFSRDHIAAINTHNRIEQDLNDWEQALNDIRRLISLGEISHDGDEFTDARRKIAGILSDIENTRQFIQGKREIAADRCPLENIEQGAAMIFDS